MKENFDLDKIAETINSKVIAGKIVGSTITGFKIEPIKGKKTIMRVTILTDSKKMPIVRIQDILNTANLIDFYTYKEYDLSAIRLNVKLTGDYR